MAVSWLFVERNFHNETEPKVKEMVNDIKDAFASMVIDSDWMDEQTKTATLEKNKKMSSLIGYPRWLFNTNDLNDYYEGVGRNYLKYIIIIIIIRINNINYLINYAIGYFQIDLSVIEYMANMMQIVRIQSTTNLKNLHVLNSDDEP